MSPSLYLPTYLHTYLTFSIKFFDQEDQVCKERKGKEKKKRGRDVHGGVENENENEMK